MVESRFDSESNKYIFVVCKEASVSFGSSCFTLHKCGLYNYIYRTHVHYMTAQTGRVPYLDESLLYTIQFTTTLDLKIKSQNMFKQI